jgi:GR25 family glycosyltransferase involved in LPS biosynthesis
MKVIVINLNDRKDRLDLFKTEWSWLPFEVSEGIRDTILHKGCGLAHINAIRKGLSENEWCLILEDDAVLNCTQNVFLEQIQLVTHSIQIQWDAVFLGANSHTLFSRPTQIERVNDYFFKISKTKSIRSCTAMLWSRNALPLLDSYEIILKKNVIFAIDRMLTSHCYPWELKDGEWDESKDTETIDVLPNVWICKNCLVVQREGLYSDNTLTYSLNYDDKSEYLNSLYDSSV